MLVCKEQTVGVTYRWAHPHITIDVVAPYDSSGAPPLLSTELVLETVVVFRQRVECAVLPTSSFWVHVDFIFDVALEKARYLIVS